MECKKKKVEGRRPLNKPLEWFKECRMGRNEEPQRDGLRERQKEAEWEEENGCLR